MLFIKFFYSNLLNLQILSSVFINGADNPSDMTAPVIATVVVLLIFILIAAVGFAVYKKKKGERGVEFISQ